MTNAKYMISQLRLEWKSRLPIFIAHCNELYSSSIAELHRIHDDASMEILNINDKHLQIHDMCQSSSPAKKKRLRSFFCKTMALVISPFPETLVLDTDVIWFKNPDNLFQSEIYLKTGSLFFRDRLLYEKHLPYCDGLCYRMVKEFVAKYQNNDGKIKDFIITQKSHDVTRNLFWSNSINSSQPFLSNVQEASVVLLDRYKFFRTIDILKKLIPTFKLGYGDKEIYWIAATISNESFSFEPHLAGIYGDCGQVIHFDPIIDDKNPVAEPYFMNGEKLSEYIRALGRGIQEIMTQPVVVVPGLALAGKEMGAGNRATGGYCGGCSSAGGCIQVPKYVNDAILKQQKYHIARVNPSFKKSFTGWLFYTLRNVNNKIIPSVYRL